MGVQVGAGPRRRNFTEVRARTKVAKENTSQNKVKHIRGRNLDDDRECHNRMIEESHLDHQQNHLGETSGPEFKLPSHRKKVGGLGQEVRGHVDMMLK